jgi:hypothetical protein
MQNNQKSTEELHDLYGHVIEGKTLAVEKSNKIKFPYEFLASVDRGWIPCDILEVDSQKELAKVIFYHPDAAGWMETCTGGIFDQVVEMWRVRLRED